MSGLLLHELGSADGMEAPARALVVILFAAGKNAEQALAFAPQWRPSVPQTAFVGIELAAAVEGTDIAALQRTAAVAATARSIRMSQIILLGAGAVGRFAVDLVLRGAIPAMGVIGLDIPPCPLRRASYRRRPRSGSCGTARARTHTPPIFARSSRRCSGKKSTCAAWYCRRSRTTRPA